MKKIYSLIIALFLMNGAMAQWYFINPNDSTCYDAIYFTDANTGYATKDSTILKTVDGGMNWIPQYVSNNGWYFTSLFFPDANTGYALQLTGVSSCRIFKTSNGGSDWTAKAQFSEQLSGPYFIDADTGYLIGPSIYKTSNGGTNWIKQFDGQGTYINSISFIDANIGYAVGGYGTGYPFPIWHRTIHKTINGGLDWISIMDSIGRPFGSVIFFSADTGYVANVFGFQKTFDGGLSWIDITNGAASDDEWRGFWFTDVNTGYATSALLGSKKIPGQFTIIKTTDGGSNWFEQSIDGGPIEERNGGVGPFFPVADTGYISTQFGILKTENGGGFPAGIEKQHDNAANLSIFPNPASNNFKLKFPAKGTLYIYNTSGQQVIQKKITELNTIIDVSTLPCGIYLVKVINEKGVQVGKLIRQ